MIKNQILIVEDETAIRDLIKFALEPAGFELLEAENSKIAEQHLSQNNPALILLDWMLPGMSGIDFIKQLKQNVKTRDIPIIMLTAKAEESNKIKGLETGADDYITKPFSPRELIARIKTVLRRGLLATPEGIIQIQDLCLNTLTRQLTIKDKLLKLPPIEYRLLHFFITHQNRVYSREQLLDHIWGNEIYIDERTVDVQIRRLRRRLKPYNYDQYIQTARGAGYQFVSRVDES